MSSHELTVDGRPRARALGFEFDGVPGATNSLTEVHGVEVGVKTIISGDSVRTGVTAIHLRSKGQVTDPIAAEFHCQNRNGEMTGVSWISESGTFSCPVVISNTHNVGVGHAGVVAWTVKHHCEAAEVRLLPVVGETWNGYLNDINSHPVTEEDVVEALESATSGPVAEGPVGGATVMNCYEFKGNNRSASRVVSYRDATYTVGVLPQGNFGSREELPSRSSLWNIVRGRQSDAPLLPGQCQALARRVTLGLARTGTTDSHFSGDLFLACSTGMLTQSPLLRLPLPTEQLGCLTRCHSFPRVSSTPSMRQLFKQSKRRLPTAW